MLKNTVNAIALNRIALEDPATRMTVHKTVAEWMEVMSIQN
jgi:hypothetical protein